MTRGCVRGVVALIMIFALVGCARYYSGKRDTTLHARATIAGPGITGEARLYEEYEGRVRIKLQLHGSPDSKLTPRPHAIHIYETGNCEPFSAAKGHYDGNIDLQVDTSRFRCVGVWHSEDETALQYESHSPRSG